MYKLYILMSKTPSIRELLTFYKNILEKSPQKKNSSYEFEVRFREEKINKQTYDEIFKTLSKYGFKISTTEYQLKIVSNENSDIRVELTNLMNIQEYCKMNEFPLNAKYIEKKSLMKDRKPVYNNDFAFRASIGEEKEHVDNDDIMRPIKENWTSSLKYFRYLYRTSLVHENMPNIRIDMSVVHSNKTTPKRNDGRRTKEIGSIAFLESDLLNQRPVYEVEIECINATTELFKNDEIMAKIEKDIKTTIKYIVGAIQKSPFPISFSEISNIFTSYKKLLRYLNNGEKVDSYFIGPSSITLRKDNLIQDSGQEYVKDTYCITDKADGDRKLLYIENGKLYFIDSRLNIQFTGVTTSLKIKPTLIDGEHITIDKRGNPINKYAAFDIYCYNGRDYRDKPFVEDRPNKATNDSRYIQLNLFMNELNTSLSSNVLTMIVKTFFVVGSTPETSMEYNCGLLLDFINSEHYDYNTDGIIFTSKYEGVPKSPKKVTWKKSFKWKPPKYNTIDFLMRIKKNTKGEKIIKTKQYKGQIIKYYEGELHVGFNEKIHGHPSAQQDILNLEYGQNKKRVGQVSYKPQKFYPSNPSIVDAYICHLQIQTDTNGIENTYTEEKDLIEDDTIIEFSYDTKEQDKYDKWKALRVRHDKTEEYRNKKSNYGNPYHVANDNWQSIHDPITPNMLRGKKQILQLKEDDGVYYNRKQTKSSTGALRNFHNLYVKWWLIQIVSNPNMHLIDLAVGKAGDLSKWINSQLHAVLGIDISKDNIHNSKDGACARYLDTINKNPKQKIPICMFIHGDTSKLIENGDFEKIETNNSPSNSHLILKTLMGSRDIPTEKLDPFLKKYHGLFEHKFDICSIQFALHYMFENKKTLHQFITNVSKYTKKGGYFIGTCYDGKKIYDKLKDSQHEELWVEHTKIWHITKKFQDENQRFLDDDENSLGFKISVYQETINKEFDEYLVNFDYFVKIMTDYGFELVKEHKHGIGSFKTLFEDMIALPESEQSKYGLAKNMNNQEKEISFLNNYFIFRKQQDIIHSLYDEKDEIDLSVGQAKKLDKIITLNNI